MGNLSFSLITLASAVLSKAKLWQPLYDPLGNMGLLSTGPSKPVLYPAFQANVFSFKGFLETTL